MRLTIGKGATTGFILAAIGLITAGCLSYANIRQIARNNASVAHTDEVLDGLRDILAGLSEAETEQRGYVLTGDSSYKERYASSIASVAKDLAEVENLTVDNSTQQVRLKPLRRRIQDRIDSLREGMALRDASGLEAGRQYILTGKGKRVMEEVRVRVGECIATEQDLLTRREMESSASYSRAILTVLASTLLGLALVGIGYGMAAREITTRVRAAEELQHANEELEGRVRERTADLQTSNESLGRSNRELEQFASVASHDLQEPLRKIQAFGDRLQTKCAAELGENGRDYLQRMLASATRMRSLIDALLSFSRVTTKAQPFVPVNLSLVAQDVMADLEDRLQRTGGRVEIGELPTVQADPLQMQQLLQNLIANGLKFHAPERAPLVEVKARMLETKGNGEAAKYEIAVRDNGIGFEEIYLDRIFELFQRLHGRSEFEGTGIGLAICRKIAQRHGGEITARSKPGDGATFLVTLPAQQG